MPGAAPATYRPDSGARCAGPVPALEAIGVVKRYGSARALDSVSIVVPVGTCVAIVGESGSGKSTLLRSFNRLTEIDSGRVLVRGSDAATSDPVTLRRSMGYVPQDGGLLPHWSVLKNAALVPWLSKDPDANGRARRALELVDLPAERFGSRWPSQLSGGQRQRASLARALAGGADILLLDEPFSALDAISKVAVQDTFSKLRSEMDLTVVLVTHDLREAVCLADRMAVMRSGRVDYRADAGTALTEGTPYARELFRRAGLT